MKSSEGQSSSTSSSSSNIGGEKLSSPSRRRWFIFGGLFLILTISCGVVVTLCVLLLTNDEGGTPSSETQVNLTAEKAAFSYYPDASLFVPWNNDVTINYTKFTSTLEPYDPARFNGYDAFLAFHTANFTSYELPFTSIYDNPMTPMGTMTRITNDALYIGLYGATGDVTAIEFEVVRDIIEVLAWVVPTLVVRPAASEEEANFAIYIANDPENSPDADVWQYYRMWRDDLCPAYGQGKLYCASAEAYQNHPYGDTTLWSMRLSNQQPEFNVTCGGSTGVACVNRGTMYHEFLHLMGLGHYPYSDSAMASPPQIYWTKVDLAIVAVRLFCFVERRSALFLSCCRCAILAFAHSLSLSLSLSFHRRQALWDPRVSKSVTSTSEMCDALAIDDDNVCSRTASQGITEAEFHLTARDDVSGWDVVSAYLCLRDSGRAINGPNCTMENASEIAGDYL